MKRAYKNIIFLVLCFSFIYYLIHRSNQVNCSLYKGYKKSSFEGIVIKKFIDVNEHSFPFVYVRNYKSNQLEKLNLFYDNSAYAAIHLKDSIIKLKNDPWIYKKNGQILLKVKIITFGCQKL